MKYKIFQIYFQENQLKEIDPILTPFNNISNLKPELREYYCFKRIIDENHIQDLDAWGVLGPRWKEKLRYSATDIKNSIELNKNYDVWIFNHARVHQCLTFNVWEQGEIFHKGIKNLSSFVMHKLKYPISELEKIMTEETTCYCSYFVAKKSFWIDYINFLDQVFSILHNPNLPEDIKHLSKISANYDRDFSLTLFPFIIERFFSTFISMNKHKYKIYFKPYDYSVYSKEIGDFSTVLHSLNKLKTLISITHSNELFEQWNNLRNYYLKNFPSLMNLD